MFVECRLLFWDTVKDKYKVDMSAMKPFARKCLTDRIHVQPVDAQDIMSQPAEICSYSLLSVQLSELLNIKVHTRCHSAFLVISIFLGFAKIYLANFRDPSDCSSSFGHDLKTLLFARY